MQFEGQDDAFFCPSDARPFADETATLLCYDAASGKQLWRHKYGRNAKGSPVLADGKIYVGEVNGRNVKKFVKK